MPTPLLFQHTCQSHLINNHIHPLHPQNWAQVKHRDNQNVFHRLSVLMMVAHEGSGLQDLIIHYGLLIPLSTPGCYPLTRLHLSSLRAALVKYGRHTSLFTSCAQASSPPVHKSLHLLCTSLFTSCAQVSSPPVHKSPTLSNTRPHCLEKYYNRYSALTQTTYYMYFI